MNPETLRLKECIGHLLSENQRSSSPFHPISKEDFYWSCDQITVVVDEKTDLVLTDPFRIEELNRVRKLVEEKAFTLIVCGETRRELSGTWFADPNHPYYQNYVQEYQNENPGESSIMGSLNNWDNIKISWKVSLPGEPDKWKVSSVAKYINFEEGWVYTSSGSLYKFK